MEVPRESYFEGEDVLKRMQMGFSPVHSSPGQPLARSEKIKMPQLRVYI
jgi:hypothetical protein